MAVVVVGQRTHLTLNENTSLVSNYSISCVNSMERRTYIHRWFCLFVMPYCSHLCWLFSNVNYTIFDFPSVQRMQIILSKAKLNLEWFVEMCSQTNDWHFIWIVLATFYTHTHTSTYTDRNIWKICGCKTKESYKLLQLLVPPFRQPNEFNKIKNSKCNGWLILEQ